MDELSRKRVWLENPLGSRIWFDFDPYQFWNLFLSLCWKYATFDLPQVCCKRKIFWDFCCLNFVNVWGFCLSVVCVGYSCNSLIYFSWDISSCLNALFCLMLLFFSPSSLLLCIVGIIQLLRAVSSFLLQSQSFSTSLATYVILLEFGVFVLAFICFWTLSPKSPLTTGSHPCLNMCPLCNLNHGLSSFGFILHLSGFCSLWSETDKETLNLEP